MTTEERLSELALVFARLGARWALIGAHAANRYRGAARTTLDIDTLVASTAGLAPIVNTLLELGWQQRSSVPVADMARLVHPDFGPLDLVIAATEYQVGAIQRAQHAHASTQLPIPVLTIEDVIVHKLIAGRFRDLADVEAILQTRPVLDRVYLDHWLEYWEISDRWRSVGGV